MKTRNLFVATVIIAAIMAAFAFLTANQLPVGSELPTRWDFKGNPVKFMPALQAGLIPAGITLAIGILFAIIPAIEPLQDKLEGSEGLLRASWIGTVFLMLLTQAVICLPGWGISIPVNAVFFGTGALLILIGNALPKSRPGFFVGIRTPWTITDTDNWIATHRLGGRLFMLAGAAIMIAAVLPTPAEIVGIIVLAAVLTAALIPVIYSWWLWQSGKQA